MPSLDLHEVVMRWPHTDADNVVVTGTFDQWQSSIRLERTPSGFEAPIRVPFGERILYKFVVDGRWVTDDNAPTATESGFINNVYDAPEKPSAPIFQEIEPTSDEPAVSAAQTASQQSLALQGLPSPAETALLRSLPTEAGDETASTVKTNDEGDDATVAAAEPANNMFDYAKGIAASFFPSLTPKGSRSSTPTPARPVPNEGRAPEPEPAPPASLPITFVPVAAPQEELERAVITDSISPRDGESALQASTHIPLPPSSKIESAVSSPTEPADVPVAFATESGSATAEAVEGTKIAPLATAEMTAPPPLNEPESDSALPDKNGSVSEVAAAPSLEGEPKEVVPTVSAESDGTRATKPNQAISDGTVLLEPVKDVSTKISVPTKEEEKPAIKASSKDPSNAFTTPKKGSSMASVTSPSNGHSRFGTLRSESIRKLSFPHRRSSSQGNSDSASVDKNLASSVKGSARHKRPSIFGKIKDEIKDVLHGTTKASK